MRCLGASQSTLVGIHVGELLLLGLLGSLLGVVLAYGLQWGVAGWLASALKLDLPAAGLRPALEGLGVGLTVLLAFAVPPVDSRSTPSACRPRASSTTPVLSETESSARRTGWRSGVIGHL
jgi:putative ABC transport system permease protein